MSVTALQERTETQLRRAPFSTFVEAELRAGKFPNVKIYATPNAWDRAKRHRDGFGQATAMALPPGISPLDIRWPPLRNVVADVTGAPSNTIRELAEALVRDGCLLAYLIDSDNPKRSLRVVAKTRQGRDR